MAARSRTRRSAKAEDWLVDGAGGRAPRRSKREAAAPPPLSAGATEGREKATRSEWLPAPESKRKSSARNGRRSGARNGAAAGRTRSATAKLEQRVATLERQLQNERRAARAEVEKLRKRLGERKAAISPSGRLDANSASFDQLRAIGFTPSQSAKLIAQRESAGRFKAKAELRRIPGLSKSARELIEQRVSVRR